MFTVLMIISNIVLISLTGSLIAADVKKQQKTTKKELDDDEFFICVACSVLWPIGLMLFTIDHLSDRWSQDKNIKCICGTENTKDSSHCKHCGSLLGI